MERYSRLKTRKILGVGESAEGSIPYSKISQVLGPFTYPHVKFPVTILIWHAVKILSLIGFALMKFYEDYWLPSDYELKHFELPTYRTCLILGYAILHIQSWTSSERITMVVCYMSSLTVNVFAFMECLASHQRIISSLILHSIAILLDFLCFRMLIDNRMRTSANQSESSQ